MVHIRGCVVALLVVSASAIAGPLVPPAGPPADTGPDLLEIRDAVAGLATTEGAYRVVINEINTPGGAESIFRITEPGSYILADDFSITDPANQVGKDIIEVAVDGVTIDLNGFELNGRGLPPSVTGIARNGITSGGTGARRVRVHNGSITNIGGDAVKLGDGCIIHSLSISSVVDAIDVGERAIVADITARAFSGYGIRALRYARITGCSLSAATGSAGTSIGVNAAQHSVVSDCVVTNADFGYLLGGIAERCLAKSCGVSFRVDGGGGPARLVGCVSDGTTSGEGFFVASPSTILVDCISRTAATDGFRVLSFANDVTIQSSHAAQSGGAGITVESGASAVISDCHVASSGAGGIQVRGSSIVTHCLVEASSTQGIGIGGSFNRIDSNTLVGNLRGVEAIGTMATSQNTVTRNTLFSNGVDTALIGGTYYPTTDGHPFANISR